MTALGSIGKPTFQPTGYLLSGIHSGNLFRIDILRVGQEFFRVFIVICRVRCSVY